MSNCASYVLHTHNILMARRGNFNHIRAAVTESIALNINYIEIKRFMTTLGMSGAPFDIMDEL